MQDTEVSKVGLYTIAVLVLSIAGMICIVTLALFKPGDTSTGTIILGIIVPSITAFLAAAINGVHRAVNGRLTELLRVTASSAKAQGIIEEKDRSSNLNGVH